MSLNFVERHLGPKDQDIEQMLGLFGFKTLNELIKNTAPESILTNRELDIGPGLSEAELLKKAHEYAQMNTVAKSFIGQGYYGTHTPTVILRNVLESPAWYTAYTPYQAEISQGRMEALLNFQTMISDFTGLEMSNASLLDEGTALAEAVSMSFNFQKKNPKNTVLVSARIFSQSLEVLKTRCEPLGLEVKTFETLSDADLETSFAVVVQYPDALGEVHDYTKLSKQVHDHGAQLIAVCDLLSLCLLTPPAEWGADIAVGSSQRFGVPFGYGGPHAAYLSTRSEFQRLMPGRLIGVSKDVNGKKALRLALQTREQHIRREKATSNICTAQVLLAVMASMYAVYHGPKGLRSIANHVAQMTATLKTALTSLGLQVINKTSFDTLTVQMENATSRDQALKTFWAAGINLGKLGSSQIQISVDETTTLEDLENLTTIFAKLLSKKTPALKLESKIEIPSTLLRKSEYLSHPTFNSYHSETEMLRYIHRLEQKDLALNQAMIPLGSCTMKLNSTTEMIPVTWPEFSQIHPFAPTEQATGYIQLIKELEAWLCDITGFKAISFQPNAGSQGEYAGLLVLRKYHESRGETQRKICLIPSSAHGTNPASAVMAGFQVVVVRCDDMGNIDLKDLEEKAEKHSKELGALMVTYPSTHGVFEDSIGQICKLVHKHGGQVYMDGANLNALVGISRPGELGPDVSHLNLHKTFCIPHGGGGPGVGPIGVAAHLTKFLPGHSDGITAVSSAPYGSAGILPISWAFIAMMGSAGMKKATGVAILNANYIAKKLSKEFKVLYTGKNGMVAHECIIDVRPFRESADVTVDDIAKRLMDFGFHAPTMSWPVIGTLMIEPTESESLGELDRFCEAMLQIREEIREIESGKQDKLNNVLKNAPHSMDHVTADKWEHPYAREKAAYPLPWVRERKFWPSVSRVDNVYGDRNLVCSCPPLEDYEA